MSGTLIEVTVLNGKPGQVMIRWKQNTEGSWDATQFLFGGPKERPDLHVLSTSGIYNKIARIMDHPETAGVT